MPSIEDHKRTNDIFFGPLERPALRWMAMHMPAWVTPDMLTGLGVLGGVIIFFAYYFSRISPAFLWLASFGFVVNWVGDSMDGSLARYRNIQRPRYGFFIDHTIDVVVEAMVILGLGVSFYVRFDLACLALIGYLMLSVLVYVQQLVTNEFRISYGKLGPTEVRVIVILANTIIFFAGNPVLPAPFEKMTVYDGLVAFVVLVMAAIYVTQVIVKGRQLSREDRTPKYS